MKWNLKLFKFVSYCLSALSLFSASYLYYLQLSGDLFQSLIQYEQRITELDRKMKKPLDNPIRKGVASTVENEND